VLVSGGFYDPFWYDPWFYDPWWGYQYPPFPYRLGRYDLTGAIRLEVKPREAEVYVDGYYAGVVDDFDGVFQRLNVLPGAHEIALYLDGFRTVRQRLYVAPHNTFKLKYTMERLGAGEQPEPRPQPQNPPPEAGGAQPVQTPGRGPAGRPPPPPEPPQPGTTRGVEATAYGTIAIRVQPSDADVLIDGEKWRGPDTTDHLAIEVAEGRHTVVIQKPGYRTYVTEVQVRAGETTTLNVSLRK
jgi:hypothetical protein